MFSNFVRLTQIALGRRSRCQVADSWKEERRFVPPIAVHPLPPNHMFGGLRIGRAAIAILVALVAQHVGAAGVESSAKFDTFLKRFVADRHFRSERTMYPLRARLGNECEENWKTEKWPRARVMKEDVRPLSAAELAAQDLSQEVRNISASRIEVFQFKDEADSYLLTYRFERRNGCWFLTWFQDESC